MGSAATEYIVGNNVPLELAGFSRGEKLFCDMTGWRTATLLTFIVLLQPFYRVSFRRKKNKDEAPSPKEKEGKMPKGKEEKVSLSCRICRWHDSRMHSARGLRRLSFATKSELEPAI